MIIDELTAYILHTRIFKSTSLLVDCLSAEAGLVRCVYNRGKGVGKKNLSLYTPYWLQINSKNSLATILKLETMDMELELAGVASYCGLYLNEILVRLLAANEAQPEVFSLYHDTIVQMATITSSNQSKIEVILRFFELKLLNALGYGIDFCQDSLGNGIEASQFYNYMPSHGFQISNSGYKGEALYAINNADFSSTYVRKVVKQIVRAHINFILGGKSLKSRELFSGGKG